MPETTVKVLPILHAAETVDDLADAAKLRGRTPHAYEIEEPAEANAVRALNAAGVLADYMRGVGDAGEDLQVGLTDLLADLRHLADAAGLDWDDADKTASRRYQEEVRGAL
ncbi:hypothetical protein [Prescottella agglutinans]|uniref:Uncharacterized protein n=1 Tax=Prescottella agglutinans TaxID=1644129 RepID=A0ABT6MHZ0_9NOCA|nr:hypothetical protein [Prescottella agglutinans]MDH6283939.1 hypothetical protein [Prescottella agglutinans]